jgi:diketogulonate reductase-like aldo/keto reductase
VGTSNVKGKRVWNNQKTYHNQENERKSKESCTQLLVHLPREIFGVVLYHKPERNISQITYFLIFHKTSPNKKKYF